jgi:spore coat protein A, manganese oxidase
MGMGAMQAWSDGGAKAPKSPPVAPFQVPLPLPSTHTPFATTDGDGNPVGPGRIHADSPVFKDGLSTDYFDVEMKAVAQQILPGAKTTVWTYSGAYPGPSFKARKNRRNVVRFINNIGVPITGDIHLHGAHTAPQFDGFPDDGLITGAHKDYIYDNDDDDFPATLWYHDHSLDFTGRNVYMGLAGFYLLQDNVEDALRLPGHPQDVVVPNHTFDVPLVFQDRLFDANNQLFYNSFSHDGLIGDTFLVNGAVQPFYQVARRKYRFRILNGSNARIYQLVMSDGSPFRMIATEGGLFAGEVQQDHILFGMAERFEFIIDFSKYKDGTKLTLNNIMQQSNGRGPDGPDPRKPTPLVQFRVVESTGVPDSDPVPTVLRTDQPTFNIADAVAHRSFEFVRSQGAWQVNGRFFDPERDDAVVKRNSTEIWTLKNGGGGWWHPIHIHLIRLRVIERNGGPPTAIEAAGCKDTFLLAGGDEVKVITRFVGDENHTGRYVFHCHNVEHEDMRMMAVMNIVS